MNPIPTPATVEPQYQAHVDLRDRMGLVELGVEKSGNWRTDPRRLVFVLSRYKFVAKMLTGRKRILEVGCGDGWPAPIVLQEVGAVHGIDIDPVFIADARRQIEGRSNLSFDVHDMLAGPLSPPFDAAYSLDVIEHIPREDCQRFIGNVADSIVPTGVLIVGMPSLHSQQYASPISKAGHVNCMDAATFRQALEHRFHSVFIFSMNDEVVHTGFFPMAQYLFALCAHKR